MTKRSWKCEEEDPIRIWPESWPSGIDPSMLEVLAYVGHELAMAAELELAGVHSDRIEAAMSTAVRVCQECTVQRSQDHRKN
jgi:hypothetical protein